MFSKFDNCQLIIDSSPFQDSKNTIFDPKYAILYRNRDVIFSNLQDKSFAVFRSFWQKSKQFFSATVRIIAICKYHRDFFPVKKQPGENKEKPNQRRINRQNKLRETAQGWFLS